MQDRKRIHPLRQAQINQVLESFHLYSQGFESCDDGFKIREIVEAKRLALLIAIDLSLERGDLLRHTLRALIDFEFWSRFAKNVDELDYTESLSPLYDAFSKAKKTPESIKPYLDYVLHILFHCIDEITFSYTHQKDLYALKLLGFYQELLQYIVADPEGVSKRSLNIARWMLLYLHYLNPVISSNLSTQEQQQLTPFLNRAEVEKLYKTLHADAHDNGMDPESSKCFLLMVDCYYLCVLTHNYRLMKLKDHGSTTAHYFSLVKSLIHNDMLDYMDKCIKDKVFINNQYMIGNAKAGINLFAHFISNYINMLNGVESHIIHRILGLNYAEAMIQIHHPHRQALLDDCRHGEALMTLKQSLYERFASHPYFYLLPLKRDEFVRPLRQAFFSSILQESDKVRATHAQAQDALVESLIAEEAKASAAAKKKHPKTVKQVRAPMLRKLPKKNDPHASAHPASTIRSSVPHVSQLILSDNHEEAEIKAKQQMEQARASHDDSLLMDAYQQLADLYRRWSDITDQRDWRKKNRLSRQAERYYQSCLEMIDKLLTQPDQDKDKLLSLREFIVLALPKKAISPVANLVPPLKPSATPPALIRIDAPPQLPAPIAQKTVITDELAEDDSILDRLLHLNCEDMDLALDNQSRTHRASSRDLILRAFPAMALTPDEEYVPPLKPPMTPLAESAFSASPENGINDVEKIAVSPQLTPPKEMGTSSILKLLAENHATDNNVEKDSSREAEQNNRRIVLNPAAKPFVPSTSRPAATTAKQDEKQDQAAECRKPGYSPSS